MEDFVDVLLEGDGPYVGQAVEIESAASSGEEESDAEIRDEENLEKEKQLRIQQQIQTQSLTSIVEPGWAPDEDIETFIAEHEVNDDSELDEDLVEEDDEHDAGSLVQKCSNSQNTGSMQVYVGAEMYGKRMYPHGCPSFQKAFVKLFRVEKDTKKLKLLDARFFDNREGFGYIMRNLTKGDY